MAWTKYNNPHKKRRMKRKPLYSQQYINERRYEMYDLLAKAKDDTSSDYIEKAFDVSINP